MLEALDPALEGFVPAAPAVGAAAAAAGATLAAADGWARRLSTLGAALVWAGTGACSSRGPLSCCLPALGRVLLWWVGALMPRSCAVTTDFEQL